MHKKKLKVEGVETGRAAEVTWVDEAKDDNMKAKGQWLAL